MRDVRMVHRVVVVILLSSLSLALAGCKAGVDPKSEFDIEQAKQFQEVLKVMSEARDGYDMRFNDEKWEVDLASYRHEGGAVDWRVHLEGLKCGAKEILNQGSCGYCWAHAAATILGARLCLLTGGAARYAVSIQDIVENQKHADKDPLYYQQLIDSSTKGSEEQDAVLERMPTDMMCHGDTQGERINIAFTNLREREVVVKPRPKWCSPLALCKTKSAPKLLIPFTRGDLKGIDKAIAKMHSRVMRKVKSANDATVGRPLFPHERERHLSPVCKAHHVVLDQDNPMTLFNYGLSMSIAKAEKELRENGPFGIQISSLLFGRRVSNMQGTSKYVSSPTVAATDRHGKTVDVITYPDKFSCQGAHMVTVMGWVEAKPVSYWVLQNSWGGTKYEYVQKGRHPDCRGLSIGVTTANGVTCGYDLMEMYGVMYSFAENAVGPRIATSVVNDELLLKYQCELQNSAGSVGVVSDSCHDGFYDSLESCKCVKDLGGV